VVVKNLDTRENRKRNIRENRKQNIQENIKR
jgi:hypothetical protein